MPITSYHIRKNDQVKVIAGSQRGKVAKVIHVNKDRETVVLEGVNLRKKHARPTQDRPKGGIIDIESPMNISNVQLVCTKCGKPTRVAMKPMEGRKVRACRKCKEIIDKV
jgi:large subunit ribosomal protein L24